MDHVYILVRLVFKIDFDKVKRSGITEGLPTVDRVKSKDSTNARFSLSTVAEKTVNTPNT